MRVPNNMVLRFWVGQTQPSVPARLFVFGSTNPSHPSPLFHRDLWKTYPQGGMSRPCKSMPFTKQILTWLPFSGWGSSTHLAPKNPLRMFNLPKCLVRDMELTVSKSCLVTNCDCLLTLGLLWLTTREGLSSYSCVMADNLCFVSSGVAILRTWHATVSSSPANAYL